MSGCAAALTGARMTAVEGQRSNTFAGEVFRHHSYVSPVASGVICGLGPIGYVLALEALAKLVVS